MLDNSSTTGINSGEAHNKESLYLFARVVNILILCVTILVLISLIVFGTVARRWKKQAGGSSLNSGVTFVSCVVATALTLPRLVVNEVVHYMRLHNTSVIDCGATGNITGSFYFISQYGFYAFLWILLWKIYLHPYVKDKINKSCNWCLIAFLAVFTVMFIVGVTFTVSATPVSWAESGGCSYDSHDARLSSALITLAWILIQVVMVILYVHAALRTHLVSTEHARKEDKESNTEDSPETCCTSFCSTICTNDSVRTIRSPVELSVKRGVISVMVIVISDVTCTSSTVFLLPSLGFVVFPSFLLDVSVAINMFCIVAALGCSSQVLGWWIPKCRKVAPVRKRNRSVVVCSSTP